MNDGSGMTGDGGCNEDAMRVKIYKSNVLLSKEMKYLLSITSVRPTFLF